MSLKDVEDMTPRSLVNPKSISAAIEYFFGRGELSQVVDQTNPLSMLTHERRLSALGPGGLNRKRAGFEVRDVHISHYGRICPIETPEGTNIGLISSLAIYAGVDEYGFLVTPYRKVKNGKLTDEIEWLRADEEHEAFLAPADAPIENGKLDGRHDHRPAPRRLRDGAGRQGPVHRRRAEPDGRRVGRPDPVPRARRRQPRLDGFEHAAAGRAAAGHRAADGGHGHGDATSPATRAWSSAPQQAARSPTSTPRASRSAATSTSCGSSSGLNERTCQNQKPIVKLGQKVEKGQVIADGAATYQGELALGRNVLVAFMSWDGFNFEDAIIISEELVKNDTYTSIHIEEFDIEIRETKLGREEFTRDIPNVSEKALRNLDENGIVRDRHVRRAGRHPGRQGLAEVEDRADAGREAAARDLRPGRRGREERFAGSALGRRRHRDRHAEVLAAA